MPKHAFFPGAFVLLLSHHARRIGLHCFAQPRAVAEGLNIAECAVGYVGTEHEHEARSPTNRPSTPHAIARRWRLVGLSAAAPPARQKQVVA